MRVVSYIALGSNLNNPKQQLQDGLLAMAKLPKTTLLETSSFYQTKPHGPQDQPDFMNAVAAISTSLAAHDLLHALQAIEHQQGRIRSRHWGPRTLDLDVLLYGDEIISDAELTVPHPCMLEREFVMLPLAEIAPNLCLPSGGRVSDITSQFEPANG